MQRIDRDVLKTKAEHRLADKIDELVLNCDELYIQLSKLNEKIDQL